MGSISVDQVMVTPLKRIALAGGDVLHGIKCSDPGFVTFGEAYFSRIENGAIKAWKRHVRMTLNLVVPFGAVHFIFVDDDGGQREETIGLDRYVRLTVPPGLWFGFRGLQSPYSLVMNVADIPHDPDEVERKAPTEIKFDWEQRR